MPEKNFNLYSGELAEGCKLCMKGAKLVLFVTGLCRRACYYCPLSEKRKGVDKSWANERPVSSAEDVLIEAERMKALGAGITGGDPDMTLDRALRYIRALKDAYGEFHVHMYTSNPLGEDKLGKLWDSGLDELRYHVLGGTTWKSIRLAKKVGLSAGVEVPAVPGEEKKLFQTVDKAIEAGADFVNLNELEFSSTNSEELLKLGFRAKEDSYAASGSYETALEVLEKRDFNLHFCTSRYKDAVQLRRRLVRIARNTAKDFEEITEEGLLLKGVLVPLKPKELYIIREQVIKHYSVPQELIQVDQTKNRIETTREIASYLADELRGKAECYIIEEYPTYDRLETEVTPL